MDRHLGRRHMKVIRQSFRLASGALFSVAYVKANWFERRNLDDMMRRRRHNMRPAHNWTGPRKVGASYVMRPKGTVNADMGPDRTRVHPLVGIAVKPEFTWLDFSALCASSTLWSLGYEASGWIVGGLMGAVAIYLRHKLKGVTP